MAYVNSADLASALALVCRPIRSSPEDYDPLIDRIGEAHFALLGEATHGTREFYRERALITRRLIAEKGFEAVAVEADWPDAYRVNRFVKGEGDVLEGADPLSAFRRFPQWMWRNTEVLDFVLWLRQWNDALPRGKRKVGFYGLDLYGLHASIEAVLAYLEKVDAEAAMRARERYACFEGGWGEGSRYGYEAALGLTPSCEREALQQLIDLRHSEVEYSKREGPLDGDEFFQAEQNARLVVNAERYYRTMFLGRLSSWNLRDRHMADTLEALAGHIARLRGGKGKARIVVWEHNSHLGDARATESADEGEINVGQLIRERHGDAAALVGMSTYTGTVYAASDWGSPGEAKRVRPALPDSYEDLFHETGVERFFLDLRDDNEVIRELAAPRLQRAIGVVYRPEIERASHYFRARLTAQFDALLHIDHTHAVDPLGPAELRGGREVPETFPSAV